LPRLILHYYLDFLNALRASINERNIVMAYRELRSANNYAAFILQKAREALNYLAGELAG